MAAQELVIDLPSPDKAAVPPDLSTGLTPSFGAVAVDEQTDAIPSLELGEAAAPRPGGASPKGSMAAPPRKSPRPQPDAANDAANGTAAKKPRLSFDSSDETGEAGKQGEGMKVEEAADEGTAVAEPAADAGEERDESSGSDSDNMLMLLPAHRRKPSSPKKKKKGKANTSTPEAAEGEGGDAAESPKTPKTPTIDPQAAAEGWALPKSSSSKKKPGQRGVGKFKRQVSETPTDDYEDEGDWHEFYEGTKASRGKGAQQGSGGKHTKTGAAAQKRAYAIEKRNVQRANQVRR